MRFVAGATAATGGVLCGTVVVLTRQAATDWITAGIAVLTLGVLWRFLNRLRAFHDRRLVASSAGRSAVARVTASSTAQ